MANGSCESLSSLERKMEQEGRVEGRVKEPEGVLLTLHRGLFVLEAIARSDGQARAKDLAETTGVNLATCYQILRTLQHEGYVTRLRDRRYRLGPRLGFLVEHYDRQAAPPGELLDILDKLHQDLDESSYMTARSDSTIAITAYRIGTRTLRVGNLEIGFSGHPHARASCKAILAFLSEPEVESFLSGTDPLPAVTSRTFTDWQAFLVELKRTRERGYAIDHEEFAPDVGCVAAPFFDEDGSPVGSYATSMPVSRLNTDEEEFASRIIEAARQASHALGWTGDYPPSG
jgi:IclR family acetate operon transcriptional repressor